MNAATQTYSVEINSGVSSRIAAIFRRIPLVMTVDTLVMAVRILGFQLDHSMASARLLIPDLPSDSNDRRNPSGISHTPVHTRYCHDLK
jgi:hypothetical protein